MEPKSSPELRSLVQSIRHAARALDRGNQADIEAAYCRILAGICDLSESDADRIESEFSAYEKKLLTTHPRSFLRSAGVPWSQTKVLTSPIRIHDKFGVAED